MNDYSCFLRGGEFHEFKSLSNHQWDDIPCENQPTKVTMDESKEIQWQFAKEELHHIKKSVKDLVGISEDGDGVVDKLHKYSFSSSYTS